MAGGGGGPVLICFDGSDGAQAAVDAAARLFTDSRVVIACYWQPFAASSKRLAIDILELVQDPAAINEREEQLASDLAAEGARLSRAAGLAAEAVAVRADGSIDEVIFTHADELDAAAIVLGSRSRTRLRSLILGNIANEVVQRATRPVFVVPSRELARRRMDERTRDDPA